MQNDEYIELSKQWDSNENSFLIDVSREGALNRKAFLRIHPRFSPVVFCVVAILPLCTIREDFRSDGWQREQQDLALAIDPRRDIYSQLREQRRWLFT